MAEAARPRHRGADPGAYSSLIAPMPYFNNHQYASGKKVSLYVSLAVPCVRLFCLSSMNTHTDTPRKCSAEARFMIESPTANVKRLVPSFLSSA